MKIVAVILILICPLILSFVFYHLSVDAYREEEKEREIEREKEEKEREKEREMERMERMERAIKFSEELKNERLLRLSPEWTDLQTDINSVIYL